MRWPFYNRYDKGILKELEKVRRATRQNTEYLRNLYWQQLRSQSERLKDPQRLMHHEHQGYSQHGEDGIISEIFRRIGERSRFFVEFGVGDGTENNTAALLMRGWKGAWIEGSDEYHAAIQANCGELLEDGRLRLKQAMITAENIEELFKALDVPSEFDLLSIDIDGNDYWVWKAIQQFQPRVVVVEYNSVFEHDVFWVMKYNPKHVWSGGCYFGASLKALEKLGAAKGYSLVGCDFSGVNAFFVRSDEAEGKFLSPFTSENHYEPPRYNASHRVPHRGELGPYITKDDL